MAANELTIEVLGCSGSYSDAGKACSGYLISSDTTRLWVDCGPGTFANLLKRVALADIDSIIVSHHHPDHCAELPVVYNAARYYLGMKHLSVITTADVRRVTDEFQDGGTTEDLFDWQIVSDGHEARVGDIDVSFSRTDHPVETLAMRFDCGSASIVYTSDTGCGWSLAQLGPNPSLVVGEGTLLADPDVDQSLIPHITCELLAQQANEVGAGQLVVTHVPPGSDPAAHLAEAAATFDGPAAVAFDGAQFCTRRRND